MSSSNTGNTKNSTEETEVIGDTPPQEAIAQLAKDVMTKHVFNTKYTQRQWDRTVGWGKVPDDSKSD